MSNNSLYEITQLLYDVLDRVTRLENELLGKKDIDLDGGVPFNVVSDEEEKVIEFPTRD